MININTNGLLVDADFLMNYKNFNLSEEEAMFLLQINYLTEQGKKLFSVNSFAVALNLSEQDIFEQINNLLNKKVIRLANDNKIEFLIFTKDDKYYTLRELLKLVERVTTKVLTSKELDIVTSWFDKKYTKKDIDEALSISRNISYVNGILNNKVSQIDDEDQGGSKLGYDWFNKEKKIKAQQIMEYLDKIFPNVDCELNFSNNLELIIAVLLSAQCKDEYVNRATVSLFKHYKTIDDYADARVEDIEKHIRTLGLYKAKSKNIVGMANMLRDVYNYDIPKTREELETLPGVGRKTANVVLAVGFNVPAIAVDTHVERVAKMFGLADKNDNPLQVEKKLMSIFPMESWGRIHHQLIHLGRYKLPARGEKIIDPELEKLLI